MSSTLNRIWMDGISRMKSDELTWKQQVAWVTQASTDIRKINSKELLDREFIYVPNDNFMLHFFGAEIAEYKYGVYRNDECNFYKRLLFPIKGFNNEVVAFGGWANDSQWKYVYSPDTLWDKNKYFYAQPDDFKQALIDDYIIVVDGIFDAISLNQLGLHAVSLMGSNLSNWHKMYLKLFKYIIVIPDNDNAGVSLVNKLRKFRRDVIVLQQGSYKDIDDFIKYSDTASLVEQCNNLEVLQVLHSVTL